jgi:hypothetical protein
MRHLLKVIEINEKELQIFHAGFDATLSLFLGTSEGCADPRGRLNETDRRSPG